MFGCEPSFGTSAVSQNLDTDHVGIKLAACFNAADYVSKASVLNAAGKFVIKKPACRRACKHLHGYNTWLRPLARLYSV